MSSLPPSDDPTTWHVRRAHDGDQESLAWVVQRFSPLLLMQAQYRMAAAVQEILEPEDLVSEVWLIALRRVEELQPRAGRLTPVLMRFLSVTLLQTYNNHARYAARLGQKKQSLREAGTRGDRPKRQEVPSVVRKLLAEEAASELMLSLKDLSPESQEIVVLRCVEQLSNQEASKLLGITESAAASRFARARQRLLDKSSDAVLSELLGERI